MANARDTEVFPTETVVEHVAAVAAMCDDNSKVQRAIGRILYAVCAATTMPDSVQVVGADSAVEMLAAVIAPVMLKYQTDILDVIDASSSPPSIFVRPRR